MDLLFAQITGYDLLLACMVALLAGVVKGMVGFAMPLIMISLLSSIVSPSVALAGLILPTMVTNGIQALRQGRAAAVATVVQFRVFMGVGLVALLAGAQMVAILPQQTLLLVIAVPILLFTGLQLAGWQPHPLPQHRTLIEAGVGAVAGFVGGMSGVWGPPTVMLLTALDTPKIEHLRAQGVIYGLGALALVGAHVASGVLTWGTALFSAVLVVPAFAGMRIGLRWSDRFDQATFRRVTLMVLAVVALNLLRRGIMG